VFSDVEYSDLCNRSEILVMGNRLALALLFRSSILLTEHAILT
jgi:hypothetical protein